MYADYWVAYVLDFGASGRIVAADPRVNRYPPYLALVERSRHPAWVFVRPSALPELDAAAGPHAWTLGGAWTPSVFETLLKDRRVPYRVENAGWFTIVLPIRPVAPSVVSRAPLKS